MNTERVATFKKISYEQFKKDLIKYVLNEKKVTMTDADFDNIIRGIYDNIQLPARSTIGSAGYDFRTPINIKLYPGESICIPTGIRCEFNDLGYFLGIYSRSSLGIFQQFNQLNLTSIIDADYYYSDNEGHIMIEMQHKGKPEINTYDIEDIMTAPDHETFKYPPMVTESIYRCKRFFIPAGDKFVQGIFIKYGITNGEKSEELPMRNGGWGSTTHIGG